MTSKEGRPAESAAAPATGYRLAPGFVRDIVAAAAAGEAIRTRELLAPLHAADVADLFDQATSEQRQALFHCLGGVLDPAVLAELDESVRDEMLGLLAPREVAEALTGLDTDDAIDILEDLDEAEQREVLAAVPAAERVAVEQGLGYAEDSAGRLMQRDFVAVPQYWNVGQIIDYLRDAEDLPDEFFSIFVVDPGHHPVGTIPLSRAMRSGRKAIVADIMDREPRVVPVATDQEDVAHIFSQYDLTSAPAVDADGRIVGVIMVDDVVDVIREEKEEDLMRLGGVQQDDLYTSVIRTARTRFSWLAVNLATAIVASVVIALFDATIEQIVALAVLMPIVASMGGNAGTQTLTVAVRALATRELTATNAMRLVNKEILVGLVNGVLFALLVGMVATLWFGDVALGLVLAAAMIINLLVAGLCGILIPIGLHRAGVDPALAATVFLTTITDVVGFFAFLGLAAWLLL